MGNRRIETGHICRTSRLLFAERDQEVASRKTLNARNLEALGAQRLAELLIEVSTAHADHSFHSRIRRPRAEQEPEAGLDVEVGA